MAAHSSLTVDSAQLRRVQRTRKLVLLGGLLVWLLVLIVTRSRWDTEAPQLARAVCLAGVVLILVCIIGRTWCTLYIGGLKKRTLVVTGPYSLVRNPLYVFTSIGAAGIGAQSGSLVLMVLAAAASLGVFHVVVRREEAYLRASFPEEFASYAARVPRFLPRLTWRDAEELVVRPRLVRRTFLEGCLFLLAIPVAQTLALLHASGALPVLARLP